MAKKVKTDSLNKLIKSLSEEADKIIAEELNRVTYKMIQTTFMIATDGEYMLMANYPKAVIKRNTH